MDEPTHVPSLRLLPCPEWLLEEPALPGSQASAGIPHHQSQPGQLSSYAVSLCVAPTVTHTSLCSLHIPHLPSTTPCRRPKPSCSWENESPTEGSLHIAPTKSVPLIPVCAMTLAALLRGIEKHGESSIRRVRTLTRAGFGTHWLRGAARVSFPRKKIRRNGPTAPEEVMSPWALRDEKPLAKLGGQQECPEGRKSRQVQG